MPSGFDYPLRAGAVPSADPSDSRNLATQRSWEDGAIACAEQREVFKQVMAGRRQSKESKQGSSHE